MSERAWKWVFGSIIVFSAACVAVALLEESAFQRSMAERKCVPTVPQPGGAADLGLC